MYLLIALRVSSRPVKEVSACSTLGVTTSIRTGREVSRFLSKELLASKLAKPEEIEQDGVNLLFFVSSLKTPCYLAPQ